ncbi:MAG: EAL domain-containing protein [Zetaproteobacteria bacterium]|nr:EAL domain-containing protein [Zetaproteobacteria bacterium]
MLSNNHVVQAHLDAISINLFSVIADGVLILDAKGYIIRTNALFDQRLGYSRDALLGLHVSEIDPPEFAARVQSRLEQVDSKASAIFETAHVRKDGSIMPVEINARTIEIDAAKYYLSIVRDITEQKQMETLIEEKDKLYRTAIETSVDGFWMIDLQGNILETNDAYVRMSGYTHAQLLQMHISQIDDDHDDILVKKRIAEIVESGGHFSFEATHRHRDGQRFPVRITTTYSAISDGCCFVFISDLTQYRHALDELQLAAMVYHHSSEAILVMNSEFQIMAVNSAFEMMTGFSLADVVGKKPNFFSSNLNDASFYDEIWHTLKTENHWHGEAHALRKDGEAFVKLLTMNTVNDSQGELFRVVGLFTDITERKNIEKLVWKQANFDELTHLPNRRMFYEHLQLTALQVMGNQLKMALLLIDLDGFKEVNDTLGHAVGDLLLVEAAHRIRSCVYEYDMVARLGGDEFTVVISDVDAMKEIDRTAERVIEALSMPFSLGDEQIFISASIGIAIYPDDSEDLNILFKNADQAMYAAKSMGRKRFRYFTSDLQRVAQKRKHIISDLRIALVEKQFEVFYQPIVNLATGEIYKAEALIRWHHPIHGIIPPIDFIGLAEETGLIIPIGNWVFEQSVSQVTRWRELIHENFQISVNQSPVQIRNDHDSISWSDYLERKGLAGEAIKLEITEGLLLHAEQSVNEKLLKFRDAGIQVAIDDFGTGYSSLSYLKKFDIDFLKIDQSFVRGLGSDSSDLVLCEAIIVMAHKLGFKVIAEGVETEMQRDMLLQAGCDYAQGFLYSKAVSADIFEQFYFGYNMHECKKIME